MRERLKVILMVLGAGVCGFAFSDTATPRNPAQSGRTGLDSNEAPIALYNALGSRMLSQAKRGAPSHKSEKTPYAHAFFHPIPGRAVYRDIIRIGKIRKVNGHVIRRNEKVYEQWTVNLLGQDINKVRERLAERFPRFFFNLEPGVYNGQFTRKPRDLRKFVSTISGSAVS